MLGTFIWLKILLLILVPGYLQHPSIETNSLKNLDAELYKLELQQPLHLYCLPVFVADFRKL